MAKRRALSNARLERAAPARLAMKPYIAEEPRRSNVKGVPRR
jgi:hypothetical protein